MSKFHTILQRKVLMPTKSSHTDVTEIRDLKASLSKVHTLWQRCSSNTGQMRRIVNFSDAPGAETANKYLLIHSYMEYFNNGIKSQCDLCIYRIFITVQQFRNASRLLARFCLLYSGLQEEVTPAFLFKVRLNYVSLHCSGMAVRSQKLIELQDGESADLTAQTCVELQGCGSLMTSTVVPAEIAAPVTQIPRRK